MSASAYNVHRNSPDGKFTDGGPQQREGAAPAIIWTSNRSGACDFISEGWYAFTGQTVEDSLGNGWLRAIHPDDRARTEQAFQDAYRNVGRYSAHYRLLSANGEYRWAVGTGHPRFSATGGFEGLIGSVIDVDQHKQAEAALRESEDLFQTLADNMSQFAWMANQEGWIFWYNQRWYEFTGTNLEQMQGWGWQSVHHPDHLDRVVRLFKRCLESGEAWEDTFPLRSKTGEYRWFLSRALPIRDENGRVVRWFGTNTDITHQRETERALELANQDLEQFAAVVSHDLKHPLRNISIFAQRLERDHGSQLGEDGKELLSKIVEGTERMGRLMADLLEYSHAGAQMEDAEEPADSALIFRQVLKTLEEPISECGAVVTAEELPPVGIRTSHLEQVLQNLIANSLKYRRTDCPPQIHVAVGRDHGMWKFSVRDNGQGIAADSHESVFGLFTRLHADSSDREGTGLGLSICQRIVHRYGGRIWLESEDGKGTVFHFTVPRRR